MTLKPFACLITTAVVAFAATPAPAQNFFNPTTWFVPQRPCYGPNCAPTTAYRPARPVYGNSGYAGPVGNGSFCPDEICGPSYYRSNGYRGTGGYGPNGPSGPRYSAPSHGYQSPAPMPSGWNGNPGIVPRSPFYDNRVTPTRYDYEDERPATRLPYNGRNYGTNNNSPFYP